MEALATTDSLTQLPNRRDIQNKISQEKARCARSKQSFIIALVDIDKEALNSNLNSYSYV